MWVGISLIVLLNNIQYTYSNQSSNYLLPNLQENERIQKSAYCIYNLMKKYFNSGQSLSGSLISIIIAKHETEIQREFLKIANIDPNSEWSIVLIKSNNDATSEFDLVEKPQSYFAFFAKDRDEQFEEIYKEWTSSKNWNPLAQIVIYLTQIEESEDEMDELINEILMIFMNRKIFNVNVIARNEDNENIFYAKTTFPFEWDNNCGNRVIITHTLDQCTINDDTDLELTVDIEEITQGRFEDKFPDDLQKCTFKAFARAWEPYTFYDSAKGFTGGIDYRLVEVIAKRLNFTLDFILQNRTLYHIFQDLIDNEIDIVIGGIDEDPYISQFISSTVSYYEDELTWCVTKAEKNFNWLNFLTSVSISTWLAIYVAIFVSTLITYGYHRLILKKSRNIQLIWRILIDIQGTIYAQPLTGYHYKNISMRMVCIWITLLGFFFNNAYQSFLVSSLTRPSSLFQIRTVKQLFENAMSVTGSVEIIRHLNKDGQIFKAIRKNFRMCYNIEECLKRVAFDTNLAVAVSRQHSFYNPRIPRDRLYCFEREENIYSYLVTILTPKNYHLLHKMNPIIQNVIESGHIIKWARELNNERILKEAGQENQITTNFSLTFGQIQGAFILLAGAICCATLIFIIEILFHESRGFFKKKNFPKKQ